MKNTITTLRDAAARGAPAVEAGRLAFLPDPVTVDYLLAHWDERALAEANGWRVELDDSHNPQSPQVAQVPYGWDVPDADGHRVSLRMGEDGEPSVVLDPGGEWVLWCSRRAPWSPSLWWLPRRPERKSEVLTLIEEWQDEPRRFDSLEHHEQWRGSVGWWSAESTERCLSVSVEICHATRVAAVVWDGAISVHARDVGMGPGEAMIINAPSVSAGAARLIDAGPQDEWGLGGPRTQAALIELIDPNEPV